MFSRDDTLKVKGIAIITMFIHHLFLSPDRYQGYKVIFGPISEHSANVFALSMKICVTLFVFLSAYGITLSFKRRSETYSYAGKDVSKVCFVRYIKTMSGFYFVFILLQIYSLVMGLDWYTKVYGKGVMSVFYATLDFFGLSHLFHTPTFIATFWYMSLAQIIIFLIPLLIFIYKKLGSAVLLAMSVVFSVLFPVMFADATKPNSYAFLPVYIVCISTGVIVADLDLLKKIKGFKPFKSVVLSKIVKFVVLAVLIAVSFFFRYQMLRTTMLSVWEAILALLITAFSFEFINIIPGVGFILKQLGKYSMNMFLIHNFVRAAWYQDFIYGFKNAAIIFLVLFGICLVISILIELLKKITCFNKLVQFTVSKIN